MLADLYAGIFKVITKDTTMLSLLKIPSGDAVAKAKKVQKRSQPQDLDKNIPLIAYYKVPGDGRDRNNDNVYNATFVFDVYTKDDVELALAISKRIKELFDGEINPFETVESYEAYFEDGHESSVNQQNTYCFTSILTFSITIVD
jgi:hypothetical protein